MRASQIAARAALVCSAAGIACALWSLTDDAAAQAADRTGPLPAAVGLATELPDTPARVVEQRPPDPAELAEDAARKPETVVKHVRDQVDEVSDTAVDVVESLPSTAAELPADPPLTVTPPPAVAPPEPGPVSATVLLAGAAPTTTNPESLHADFTAPTVAALLCGDQADKPTPPQRGHVATPTRLPCTPDDGTGGLVAVKPPPKTGVDLVATAPSGPATPALRLLGELLPRLDLPTGRTEHPEPGPA